MIYKHIYLKNFVPMMKCGTTSIDVDLISNTLIIIGTNGCGKSSLIRELSPYPANRSDYGKCGIKKVTLDHNGSEYILTSDFSKPVKAHSFLKNGEELNESGANIAQVDLCKEHFGMTDVINSITNIGFNLCDMGRAERRNLFMATYPHSMSFILEYHKKVVYQLRDFGVTLRDYNERRVDLEEKILNPTEMERIYKLHKQYQETNNDIVQQIYALGQRINLLSNMSDYRQISDIAELSNRTDTKTVEEYLKHMEDIAHQSLQHLAKIRHKSKTHAMFKGDADNRRLIYYNLSKCYETLGIDISEMKADIKELKGQLDEYDQTKNIDIVKEIDILKNKLLTLEEMHTKAVGDLESKTFPQVGSSAELLRLNQTTLCTMRYLLSEVFQYTSIWEPQRVADTKQRIWSLTIEIQSLEKQLNMLRKQMSDLIHQEGIVKNIDPNCKSTICHLKEMVDEKLAITKKTIEEVRVTGKQLKAKYDDKVAEKERLTKELNEPEAADSWVRKFLEELHAIPDMFNFIVDRKFSEQQDVSALIKLMNENGTKIWDKLAEFERLNEINLKRIDCENDIQSTKQELYMMEKIHLPAKELIIKTITEKQLKYKKELATLEDYQKRILEVQRQRAIMDDLGEEEGELEGVMKELIIFKKWFDVKFQIDQASELMSFFQMSGVSIQSTLRDLEVTIKEQESYATRLNQEVLPNLKKVESEFQKWSSVEKALSPTSGIPHKYMIKYLNGLIGIVNKIIKNVWVYDMEILPIDEDKDDLDFNLPFLINGGEPIKDLSLASKGQKEIIDLAWILAFYHQMQLGKVYPLKLDEPDSGLNNEHRVKLLIFLADMMKNGDLKQLFMVNHFQSVYDTFMDSQTLCIMEEGVILPNEYNQHITVTRE